MKMLINVISFSFYLSVFHSVGLADSETIDSRSPNKDSSSGNQKISSIIEKKSTENGLLCIYFKGITRPLRLPPYVGVSEVITSGNLQSVIFKLFISNNAPLSARYYSLLCGEKIEDKWHFFYRVHSGDLLLQNDLYTNVYSIAPFENLASVKITFAQDSKPSQPCDINYIDNLFNLRDPEKVYKINALK
jgi:hypothetical protein